MKKIILLLAALLAIVIVIDLTQFSSNLTILSILVPQFRLPRLIAIIIAAIALSMAGLVTQTLTNNPLADSGTLGLTSGASFGAVSFVFLSSRFHLTGNWNFAYPIFAVVGAFLAFAILYLLALKKMSSSIKILLTGIAITAVFQSIITLMQLSINSFDFQKVAVWLSGDVWQTDNSSLILTAICLLMLLAILPLASKHLEVLNLGDDSARTLGLNIARTKLYLYFFALLFAAIGVLLVGGLAFIGLIAPHISRELVGFKLKRRVPVTMMTSTIILVLADIVSQMVIAPSSLPLGFVVALIGAPYYIYLIQKI